MSPNTNTPSSPPVETYFSSLKEVHGLDDVLNFWYPPPICDKDDNTFLASMTTKRDYLNVAYFDTHVSCWIQGGAAMDKKCKIFRTLIRTICSDFFNCNNNNNNNDHMEKRETTDSIPHMVARIILFDQITRNAFRHCAEAFAYDNLVAEVLKELFQLQNKDDDIISNEVLLEFVTNPEITFCDCFFVAIACEHQEDPLFWNVDQRIFEEMTDRWPDGKNSLKVECAIAESHYQVLKRFGRYPHRNGVKGRKHTEEEIAWLNDYEILPSWAKSQYQKK